MRPLSETMRVEIREARASDAARLTEIEAASPERGAISLSVTPVADYFAVDQATQGLLPLVACIDGRVVGTVSYRLYDTCVGQHEARVAYHSRLRVSPEVRGHGIATTLLRDALDRASRDGAEMSWGAMLGGNGAALRACQAAGYGLARRLPVWIYPVSLLARLPTSNRWRELGEERSSPEAVPPTGQLCPMPRSLATDVHQWAIGDPRGRSVLYRDLSPYWRLRVVRAPGPLRRLVQAAGTIGLAPDPATLRMCLAGGLQLRGHPGDGVRLLLGLCAHLAGRVDLLVLVADPQSSGALAARRVPGLRSSITLVTQPRDCLDSNQPIVPFPL